MPSLTRVLVTGGAGYVGAVLDGFRAGKIPNPMSDIRSYNIKTMQAQSLR